MSLPERLRAQAAEDAVRARPAHPQGLEPNRVKYAEDGSGVATEAAVNFSGGIPETEAAWREKIKAVTGLDVPEHRQVILTDTRYWGDPGALNVYARFKIVDRPDARPELDVTTMLKGLRTARREAGMGVPRHRKVSGGTGGDSAFVLSWNDWQLGKSEGGGTAATVERLEQRFKAAANRIGELRHAGRQLGRLIIVGGGDMVEGCDMFTNHSFQVDADRRSQVRATVLMGLEGLDLLAPLFESVTVLVVPGNHGENRIGHKRTIAGDNDDVAVFEHMATAAARDSRLSHVSFALPDAEQSKTLEVAGWVLGTTHGQVYGKTGSGSIEQKALKWYNGQAGGKLPIGDSDVLLTHHFHHFAARDWGGCLWLQTPAMDGGSAWLTDMAGMHSEPGMLSFVMSPESRCRDLEIL